RKISPKLAVAAGVMLVAILGVLQYLNSQGTVYIRRVAKMSPELHQRIQRELKFDGWSKKIFFKEYVPADLSYIWLITSGFQECYVDATFSSIPGKLLSQKDDKVTFKAHGRLDNHIAEFSKFDFTTGSKIIPGLYEVDVRASECEW